LSSLRITAAPEDILGRQQIGIHDDFFALGGHSLKAMTAASRIKKVEARSILSPAESDPVSAAAVY
jgi:hypothetical protein